MYVYVRARMQFSYGSVFLFCVVFKQAWVGEYFVICNCINTPNCDSLYQFCKTLPLELKEYQVH